MSRGSSTLFLMNDDSHTSEGSASLGPAPLLVLCAIALVALVAVGAPAAALPGAATVITAIGLSTRRLRQ